jgi:hypothetical protein
MDKPSWDVYRFGMICGKPEAFASLKASIEEFCNKYGCTKDQAAAIKSIWWKIMWSQPNTGVPTLAEVQGACLKTGASLR